MKTMNLRPRCSTCHVKKICFNNALTTEEQITLETLITEIKLVAKGEHICFANDPVKRIYAIFTGIAKEYRLDNRGRELVTEFYLPGNVIGLELLNKNKYPFNVVAIKETAVCIIPIEEIKKDIVNLQFFNNRVLALLSDKIENNAKFNLMTDAKSRVAILLLNIIERLHQRVPNPYPLELPVSQVEMSQRLGMSNETFNRVLRKFKQDNIINIRKGIVFNCDMIALRKVAGLSR